VLLDVHLRHSDAAHCGRGWTTKNDPFDPRHPDVERHQDAAHGNPDPVGDEPAVAERDCRLAAVE